MTFAPDGRKEDAMSVRGLEGIDETVQQTYIWIDEIAEEFHGDRHQGLKILRSFLHLLRDHLTIDESAQLAAQLPMLIRGVYYEGWDPSRSLQTERTADAFLARFTKGAGVRAMDARDALMAASRVLERRLSSGEVRQVFQSLPAHVRELLAPLSA
jgi:uncharacterized protein (DUF2267 family)